MGRLVLRARVDRPRCIGAGNCITIAPTAFDWHRGDFGKAGVVDAASVDEEKLREAALACPTQAIVLEEVAELLPWQLRGRSPTQRVQRTFMFTDIVGSTNLLEAMGDEAWQSLLSWHDKTLRALFGANRGEEVVATGDGFFVAFESPDDALACAVAIQRGLAEHRSNAGLRAAGADRASTPRTPRWSAGTSPGRASTRPPGSAVSRRADQIVASAETAVGGQFPTDGPSHRDREGHLRSDRGRHRRLAVGPGITALSEPAVAAQPFRDRIEILKPLAVRDFAFLWTGMTVSMIGDGIYLVSIAWQVLSIENRPGALALVGIAWSLPQVVLVMASGALSDRVDRRRPDDRGRCDPLRRDRHAGCAVRHGSARRSRS